jgi:hypothetical protein
MVIECCAVVARPRAAVETDAHVTEDHVTGGRAIAWANFAVAPLKRFIIEFPFVAEKAVPQALKGALLDGLCRASEISSIAAAAVEVRRHCLHQLVVP